MIVGYKDNIPKNYILGSKKVDTEMIKSSTIFNKTKKIKFLGMYAINMPKTISHS
jgi:predicted transcriptional regulator YheO